MKTIDKLATIITLSFLLASCDPAELLDPPYICFFEMENATSYDLTLLAVRHEPRYYSHNIAPYVFVESQNILKIGEVQIPTVFRPTPYLQNANISDLGETIIGRTRFLFFKGDISNELSELPITYRGENMSFDQSVWDEHIEGKIFFELEKDVFTPELWTHRILKEPEIGEYWEHYALYYSNTDNDWYKYVYWTFTLTDEHLAEYAAKKGAVE